MPPSGGAPPQAAATVSAAGATATFDAQAVTREAACASIGACAGFDVEQEAVAVGEDEEVGEPLALRRQQRGPDGAAGGGLGDVVGDEALEEGDPVLAGHLEHGAIGQLGDEGHGADVMLGAGG